MLIALAVLLTALGALLGAWIFVATSGTESYVGLREDVPRGAQIDGADLIEVNANVDGATGLIPWDRRGQVEGSYATTDIARGLPVPVASLAANMGLPQESYSIVGAALDPGQVPDWNLIQGNNVTLVIIGDGTGGPSADSTETPQAAPSGQARSVKGVVISSRLGDDGVTRFVDVRIPSGSATEFATAAGNRQVAVILEHGNDTGVSGGSDPASPSASSSPGTDDTNTVEPTN